MGACTRSSRWCGDGTKLQVLFVNTESRFSLRELDVGFPKILRRPVFDVGAQEIMSFTETGPVAVRIVDRPREISPAITFFDNDIEKRRGPVEAFEQAPDAALDNVRFLWASGCTTLLYFLKSFFQSCDEAVVYRLFFLPS